MGRCGWAGVAQHCGGSQPTAARTHGAGRAVVARGSAAGRQSCRISIYVQRICTSNLLNGMWPWNAAME